jgi:hypothetical protein
MRAVIVVDVTRVDRRQLKRSAPTVSAPQKHVCAKLTRQRLKRGVFQSVVDLQLTINRFVADTNADPKPFVWAADPKRGPAAIKRGKQTLESIH